MGLLGREILMRQKWELLPTVNYLVESSHCHLNFVGSLAGNNQQAGPKLHPCGAQVFHTPRLWGH